MSRWPPSNDFARNEFPRNNLRHNDLRHRADAVRSIPLEAVLPRLGALHDPRDRRRWLTPRGPITVTGSKFFNWHRNQGGGGAIDLVMHLGDLDFGPAVMWLQQQLGTKQLGTQHLGPPRPTCSSAATGSRAKDSLRSSSQLFSTGSGHVAGARKPLCLSAANLAKLPQVLRYLTGERRLSSAILQPLLDTRRIYADYCGNVVFRMVAGKPNRSVGAELRGTGKLAWRGLAPGTSKDAGYFWIGMSGSRKIILCESAIDAISCVQLHDTQPRRNCICISTAGVRADARWLDPLLARRYEIFCGFDNDQAGDIAASRMIIRHPSIARLRPPAHDWNDALQR